MYIGAKKTYSDDFGARVMRRTTTSLEHAAIGLQGRHTEVSDFYVGLFVQQQVFRFQISVAVEIQT